MLRQFEWWVRFQAYILKITFNIRNMNIESLNSIGEVNHNKIKRDKKGQEHSEPVM